MLEAAGCVVSHRRSIKCFPMDAAGGWRPTKNAKYGVGEWTSWNMAFPSFNHNDLLCYNDLVDEPMLG